MTRAFEALDRPDLLDNLRKATKGTVNDLELMKAANMAKDFRIPLEDLGKYLEFAQLKAQQTGQSVEYMTNSIVTGLGRKSVLILDNLGLSAAEINEQMAKTGDFMSAVASIVDRQLAEAGGNRGQAQLRNDLALRAAKVGHEDDLGAFFAQGLDGRQSSLDSTVIGDGGAVQRNIEISANQNALALEISKILECLHVYPFLAACKRGMAILPLTHNTSPNEQKTPYDGKVAWCFVSGNENQAA